MTKRIDGERKRSGCPREGEWQGEILLVKFSLVVKIDTIKFSTGKHQFYLNCALFESCLFTFQHPPSLSPTPFRELHYYTLWKAQRFHIYLYFHSQRSLRLCWQTKRYFFFVFYRQKWLALFSKRDVTFLAIKETFFKIFHVRAEAQNALNLIKKLLPIQQNELQQENNNNNNNES